MITRIFHIPRPLFFLILLLSLALCFPLPGFAQPREQASPELIIKWATIAPENTVWGDIISESMREIEKRSGGRIKNIWYFGAVMGDEPDTVRKVKLNQLQGLALLTVGLTKLAPEIMAFSLPFLFRNYEEVDCVFERAWTLVEKVFAQRGYVVFGRADIGFSILFSKKNLRTQEDFANTKTWTWVGLEVDKAAAKLYGIENIIPLPPPEVLTGLQTGMVDTTYATYYTAIALQWHTQIKFMTDYHKFGGAYAPAILVLRKDMYDQIPPDIQETMKEVFAESFPRLRRHLRQDEMKARQSLLNKGVKLIDIDPEFYKSVRAKSQLIYRDWEGEYYPSWFLQGILNARNQCRAGLAQPGR